MTPEEYDKELIAKLIDSKKWGTPAASTDFTTLVKRIKEELKTNTVSSKLATILVYHQIMHEMTKDLIELSTLYIKGEIWPSRLNLKYDNGKDKMTGWYLAYFEDNCIDCKEKTTYLNKSKRLNAIRNKIAHSLTSKNDQVINESYTEFEDLFKEASEAYVLCEGDLLMELLDLTKRVEFKELI